MLHKGSCVIQHTRGGQRREYQGYQASLGSTVRPRLAWATGDLVFEIHTLKIRSTSFWRVPRSPFSKAASPALKDLKDKLVAWQRPIRTRFRALPHHEARSLAASPCSSNHYSACADSRGLCRRLRGVRGNCDLPSPPPLGKALSVWEMGDSRTLLPALSSQIMVGDTLQAASPSTSLWRVCLGLGTVQCKGPKGGGRGMQRPQGRGTQLCKGLGLELSCAKAWGRGLSCAKA